MCTVCTTGWTTSETLSSKVTAVLSRTVVFLPPPSSPRVDRNPTTTMMTTTTPPMARYSGVFDEDDAGAGPDDALAAASDGAGIGLPPSASLPATPLSDTLSSQA